MVLDVSYSRVLGQLVMYYIWHKLPPKHRPYKHARGICISPYVGPYSYSELNYCDRLHILIIFIYIITPQLTSTHKPVLAWVPSSVYNKQCVSHRGIHFINQWLPYWLLSGVCLNANFFNSAYFVRMLREPVIVTVFFLVDSGQFTGLGRVFAICVQPPECGRWRRGDTSTGSGQAGEPLGKVHIWHVSWGDNQHVRYILTEMAVDTHVTVVVGMI